MCTYELSKLKEVVASLYGPNPSQEVLSFCDTQRQYYLSDVSPFNVLFNSLVQSTNNYFNFWILDVLNNLIISKCNSFDYSRKKIFRDCLQDLLSKALPSITSTPFTANKLSLLIINWLTFDYPENCPTFWTDYIDIIAKTQSKEEKMEKVTMLIDILHTFDEELIKFRNSNSDFQAERSVKMKDHMRVNAIPEIVKLLGQILSVESYFEKKLVSKAIKVVSELISWNLLEYFEQIIQIVINTLLVNEKYQRDCIEIINAVVKKGMEPDIKIQVLIKMDINSIINRILKDTRTQSQSLELLSEVISNIGLFLIEVFELAKKDTILMNNNQSNSNNILNNTNSSSNTNQFLLFAIKQLGYCFYFTVQIMTDPKFDYKTGMEFLDFLSGIISYIRSNSKIIENDQELLNIFKNTHLAIENALIIPIHYKIATENLALLEEDDYFAFRKEYALIYRNFFVFSFLQDTIFDHLIDKANKLSSDSSLYEIEHCLFLIGTLIGGIHIYQIKANPSIAKKFNTLISLLFSIPFTQTVSDFILLSYYDIICQAIQHILPNKTALEFIIKIFLSKKGICAEKLQTGIKIINYFDKFLTKAESQLLSLPNITLTEISVSIKQTLQLIINTGNFPLISEYQLLFHCLAIIISIDNNSATKNKNYEHALKTFIDIFTKYPINNEMFPEVVKCLTHFIKNINNEIRDNELRTLFINFFNVFIGDYCTQVLPQKQYKTLYGVVTILQRLIILLGKDSEQYLSFFFDKKNSFITSDIYEDSMKILQNMINITKKNSIEFIAKHFADFYYFIKEIPLPKEDISDVSKVSNLMYVNYMKLVNTIIYEIPEVFFNTNNKNGNEIGIANLSLVELISFMLYVAKESIDLNTRRNILRSLKLLSAYLNERKQKGQIKIIEGGRDGQFIEEIMVKILNGLFDIYPKLKLNKPLDSSSMCEICQIHYYFSSFASCYPNYLLTLLSKEQAEVFYQMIIKVNPNQIKVSNDIVQAFNVSEIYYVII